MAKKVQKTPVSAAVDNLMAGAAPALKKSSITAGTAKRHAKATASAVIAAVETAVGTFVHKVAETAVSETGSVATQTVTHQAIAKLAYSYWLERGCQGGSPVSDWFRAEQALSATHS